MLVKPTLTLRSPPQADLPRELDVEALRARLVRHILQRVAKLSELLDSGVKRLLRLVGREHRVLKLLRVLVPEAVQHRRVSKSIGVGGDVLVVQHRVLVVEALVANVGKSGCDLLEELRLVLATRLLETRLELSRTLSRALGTLGIVLGLKLAKFLGGNHFERVRSVGLGFALVWSSSLSILLQCRRKLAPG